MSIIANVGGLSHILDQMNEVPNPLKDKSKAGFTVAPGGGQGVVVGLPDGSPRPVGIGGGILRPQERRLETKQTE
jgi:hypothetical protein